MSLLHEALLYEKQNDNKVKCRLCARRCIIGDGATGFCLVRKNESGILYSLNYGKAVSACVDPISKKPLSHFNPGALVLSIASAGCNFRCQFCDNWMISQEKEGETHLPGDFPWRSRHRHSSRLQGTVPAATEIN